MDGRERGEGWMITTFMIALMALIVGIVGVSVAAGKSPGHSAAAGQTAAAGATELT